MRMDKHSTDTICVESDYTDFNGGNCYVSPSGRVFFSAEHFIWEKLPDGSRKKVSDQYLEWNQTVFVDQHDHIYVPDIGILNGALFEIDPKGNSVCIASDLIKTLNRPRDRHDDVILGIQKDASGNLYIAEKAGRRVIKISQDGTRSEYYVSPEGYFPTAVCFHDQGAYILEYNDSDPNLYAIIRQIDHSGSVSTYFDMSAYSN